MTLDARSHRRKLAAVLAGAIVLLMTVGSAWAFVLPHYRPRLQPGEAYGIDVSHHQGRIDWEQVAADDVAFAYIKATEGATHVDSRFAENWVGAQAAGLPRGAYHFYTLCRGGLEQAGNFLTTMPDDAEALPPAVDLELAGNCAARPGVADLHNELAAFLDRVELATGRQALLYVGPRFERRYRVATTWKRDLWQLSFLRRPREPNVAIWQVMGFAKVRGITGQVDLNVARVHGLRVSHNSCLPDRNSPVAVSDVRLPVQAVPEGSRGSSHRGPLEPREIGRRCRAPHGPEAT